MKKLLKINSLKFPFPPKKELGQNFLFSLTYLQKIVASCPITPSTVIIEIGSGYGTLTDLLAETNCQKIVSLEKDKQLFQWLVVNKQKKDKIIYLHEDSLCIDWAKISAEYKDSSLIVVGNLPYYIANSLIVNLLFSYQLFHSVVFLVQKEVAHRWAASPKQYSSKYSALSVFINYLVKTKISLLVPSQVFTPSPSVDGALVIAKPYLDIDISKEQLISFFRFLKNCFRLRRKTLKNNLNSFAGNYQPKWEEYWQEKNYSPTTRPQNLSPEEYWQLFIYWNQVKEK